MLEFLKNLTKQVIATAVIVLVIFLIWPGIALALILGIFIGLVAGNLFPAIERWIEDRISDYKKRR